MPGGGLMQLVAFGAQDVYLTGSPTVTFFQSQYKRHSNFAMETIQQTVSGSGGSSGIVSVTLARTGDLVGDMYMAMTPTVTGSSNLTSVNTLVDMCWVAERAITSVELFIGGQLVDKHYQLWFRLYSEVYMDECKKIGYGKLASFCNKSNSGSSTGKVYLPLLFFFNRNPGLFLPLIALQYHEVRLDFSLSPYYRDYFGLSLPEVWATFVYLDTPERERFGKTKHEYLIEQVQHVGGDPVIGSAENTPTVVRLGFNHPVKTLIWCYQENATLENRNSMWNFSTSVSNVNVTVDPANIGATSTQTSAHRTGAPVLFTQLPFSANVIIGTSFTIADNAKVNIKPDLFLGNVGWIETGMPAFTTANVYPNWGYETGPLHKFNLMLNGTDRFSAQDGKYFNQYQPYQYHSGCPYPGIYVYSFALKPEELQPSGSCNFSRIDVAETVVRLKTGVPATRLQRMFAVNYNILRIASGMGGVAFSN